MVTAASLTQRLMRAGSCRKRLLHTAAFPRTPQRAWRLGGVAALEREAVCRFAF